MIQKNHDNSELSSIFSRKSLYLAMKDERLRFLFFGGISSLVYLGLQILMVEVFGQPAVFSAFFGFAAGTIVSYILNTIFTFSAPMTTRTFTRFLISTSFGYASGMSIIIIGNLLGVFYLIGAFAGMIVAPIVNFIMHKKFTYAAGSDGGNPAG